ncbi:hypothetical protein Pla175_38940 [Pirellulimonas nuda]|uniref:Carboxypeptidase regulatory-like domain-containing protein n=2 Tax=Pirellulimonas nuda TaxID=2528009 RepID=A0A518DG99_9BACT|nr:hypothetical protein Pla175_38940 [Pirellulimonas nuda]
MHWRQPLRAKLALFAALACAGCGPPEGLQKVVVDGVVTLDGAPIPNGEIRFLPIEGTEGPVSGGPIKDGQYRAESRGGVPVGEHRVEIRAFRAPTGRQTGTAAIEGGPAEQYLPQQYNTKSELTASVSSSSAKQDFSLSSK